MSYSPEVALQDIDFDAMLRDLERGPVYLPLSLGNGTRYCVLLAVHEEGVEQRAFFSGEGLGVPVIIDGVGPSVLWVSIEGKGAAPFGFADRGAFVEPRYLEEKLNLGPGDSAQMAYLISGLRSAARGEKLEENAAFAGWCAHCAEGWQRSDEDRLPAPVRTALGEGGG
jgi:hypothetical protein